MMDEDSPFVPKFVYETPEELFDWIRFWEKHNADPDVQARILVQEWIDSAREQLEAQFTKMRDDVPLFTPPEENALKSIWWADREDEWRERIVGAPNEKELSRALDYFLHDIDPDPDLRLEDL